MFESLDSDKEDRTFSPMVIFGMETLSGQKTGFNNTLNSFMDHCWDGHYTCQKRLSRFPGLIELDKKYEIYFTGTTPADTRYTIEGAESTDFAIVQIDYSQSVIYKVSKVESGASEVDIESNRYNRTLGSPAPLNKDNCGESRYEQANFIYEFILRRNCTVYLRAQEHLIGLARLQISLDQFFEDDFTNKLAFALGITTDQIRIVGIEAGSTIVHYAITSGKTAESDQRKNLVEMAQMLASKHEAGTLDLGAEILDLINQVISSNGAVVTSGTGSYKKKEIHPVVYALLGLSAIAVLIGVVYGVVKVMKMSKIYREVLHEDNASNDKIDNNVGDKFESKIDVPGLEEVKE